MKSEITPLWSAFQQRISDQTIHLDEMDLQLYQRSKVQITNRLVDYVWACANNPRNDIDNPTRYCANFFYAANSVTLTTNIINDLRKSSSLGFAKKLLLKEILQGFEKTLERKAISFVNSPPDVWGWVATNIPSEEYFVLAFMNGSMPAEKALQLSGLSPSDFAAIVQEKALERDVPVFQAYLREENVEDQLPFSDDRAAEFKDLLDQELE